MGSNRRFWWLLAVPAVAFGIVGLLVLYACSRDVTPGWHNDVERVGWVSKWATLPTLPLLFGLAADSLRRSSRGASSVVAAAWIAVGWAVLAVLLLARLAIADATRSVSGARLWPGDADPPGLDPIRPMLDWTPTNIVAGEATVLAVAAIVVVTLARRYARGWLWGPPLIFALIGCWQVVAPWSFRLDYDTFTGDLLLGDLFGEFLFFMGPFSPVSAIALGLAAIVLVITTAALGGAEGARDGEDPASSPFARIAEAVG